MMLPPLFWKAPTRTVPGLFNALVAARVSVPSICRTMSDSARFNAPAMSIEPGIVADEVNEIVAPAILESLKPPVMMEKF